MTKEKNEMMDLTKIHRVFENVAIKSTIFYK